MADGATPVRRGMRLSHALARSMGQLLSEAKAEAAEGVEGDEEFWGQAAWQEDAADDAYESEKEEADRFDSDFMESEVRGPLAALRRRR